MQWGGRNFDSESFKAKDVIFDNPKKRLEKAFPDERKVL